MNNTKFWRCLAVLAVIGLFYVGHGLHNTNSVPLPQMLPQAHAGGVGIISYKNTSRIITSNSEGTTIHIWRLSSQAGPKFVGSYPKPPSK